VTRREPDDPIPGVQPATPLDGGAHAAWLRYLTALGDDGDCAMAASLTYRSLPPAARIAWLDALEEDAPRLAVEPFALYAPLLAVEHDAGLAARILDAMGELPPAYGVARALRGVDATDGARVAVLVRPAYLDFADLVGCRYTVDSGIKLAVREPLRRRDELPATWDGVALTPGALDEVIEDLAHAVLADRRQGRPPPEALVPFADLFGARGT
jgi:hypothetical protein